MKYVGNRCLGSHLVLIITLFVGVTGAFAVENPLATVDPKSVGSTLEVHITDDGKMILHGAQVIQVAGTTFYARSMWGNSSMRWIVRTDENTKVTRRFDTSTSVAEIRPGDIISVEGEFLAGSDSISVVAKKIKDWSLATDKAEFAGVITTISTTTTAFTIKTASGNVLTVAVGPSTSIIKGVIGASFDRLSVGERVTSATGSYNHVTKLLTADAIRLHQDQSVFKPRNFQGTLRSISGTTLPAVMVLTISGKNYTVEMNEKTEVMNRKKAAVGLKRFLIDDTVRIYGTIKKDNLTTIVAEVVRNVDL